MKNVFLIGMPSSGKSTLGKKLARALHFQFVDLDKMIVSDQRKSIPQLFKEEDESYFREVESRLLHQIRPDQELVVSTGGGTPCFYDNMEFIKNNGISIFIDVPPTELARRIINHGKDDRPLLSGITELEKELRERLALRMPFYQQADYSIPYQSLRVADLVALLQPLL